METIDSERSSRRKGAFAYRCRVEDPRPISFPTERFFGSGVILFDQSKPVTKVLGLVIVIVPEVSSSEEFFEADILVLDNELPDGMW